MKKYLSVILFVILGITSCQKPQDLETTVIKANSMVCESCVKTIEKAMYRVEGVKEVDVDLKEKTILVKYIPLQTNVATLETIISDAGYDANDRKRNSDAYEKLEACCKIDEQKHDTVTE